MKGKEELTLVAGIPHIKLNNEKIKDNCQFFSEVQCSRDSGIDAGFLFSTTAANANKLMMPLTDKQSKPLEKLKDIIEEIDKVKELMLFLPMVISW